MNESSSALVLWILLPLFVAVGFYLIWYSQRRKRMLEAFVNTHQLRIRPERKVELQKTLDSCFSLKDENLVRNFDQLSSIIDGGSIWLFRTVELLDINPHAQSYSTHFPRIVALFDVSRDHDEFFVLDKSMQVRQRLSRSHIPIADVVEITKRIVSSFNVRHLLSVTLAHGYGLIYFEPLVTGGETVSDINSLYSIAKSMRKELTENI